MHLNDLITKFSGTTEYQQKAIFSTLFIATNRLQTLFDSHIPEISLKQFMLLSIVRQSNIKTMTCSWKETPTTCLSRGRISAITGI